MSIWIALLLGLIQGICEFFPISSSAHLQLLRHFFHIEQRDIFFDVIIHGGSICALIVYLRKKIFVFFRKIDNCKNIFFALLPLVFIYFFLSKVFTKNYSIPITGMFLCVTGLFLTASIFYGRKKPSYKIVDMLYIGIAQGLALLPGLSRSGMTIATANLRGWPLKEAILFSFLLAIPTILGGIALEAWKIKAPLSLPLSHYGIGFLSSFITSSITVRIIFSLTKKKQLLIFALYCITIGIVAIVL